MADAIYPFKVGQFNCLAINDMDEWNCNVLVVNAGQKRVLVESGNGDATSPQGLLVERLRTAGITPERIDLVILSHADCDHIGGVADKNGSLTFPRAQIILSRPEWNFWSSKPERLLPSDQYDEGFRQWVNSVTETRLLHLGAKLQLVEGEVEIIPGVRVLPASGHTPGMLTIAISSKNEDLFFIADMIYDVEIGANPAWHAVIDNDPAQALAARDRLFEQAARDRTLLMAYHLPFPGLGHVENAGQGWKWIPIKTNL